MHNYLLDRMKEARRRDRGETCSERRSRHDQEIERECFRQQLSRLFRTALTAREYDCLHLRAEGLRYEEIASRLDLASGTVGALICRAVRKIRDILTPEAGK